MAPESEGRLIRSAVDRLAAAADRQRAAQAALLGLAPVDLLALHHLARPEGLAPAELARRLGRSPGGTAASVDRLERRDFVARLPAPGSRRRVLLRATPIGEAAVDALRAPLLRDVEALADRLPADDRAATEATLGRLADLYEHHADRLAAEADEAAARASGVPTPVLWG